MNFENFLSKSKNFRTLTEFIREYSRKSHVSANFSKKSKILPHRLISYVCPIGNRMMADFGSASFYVGVTVLFYEVENQKFF